MTDDRARLAQNLAARRALEAYAKTLEKELGASAIFDALNGRAHSHVAIMLAGDRALLVRVAWEFDGSSEAVVEAVQAAKSTGEAP